MNNTNNTENTNALPGNETEIDIVSFINQFWNHFKKLGWMTLILTVVFSIVFFIYGKITFTPKYRSGVRFTITPLVSDGALSGASAYTFNYNETLATQMAETFPHIMNSQILLEIIANDLGRTINGSIASKAVPDTNIFEVYVTSSSAKDAYDIVSSLMENYPKVATFVVGDTKMNVIEGSEPKFPQKPFNEGAYYTYLLIGALIGLAISAVIIVIRMKTSNVITGKRDIEIKLNGKVLCEVPLVEEKRRRTKKSASKSVFGSSGFSESVKVLKQRVRSSLKSSGNKIVGVTSSINGEGKTTVAYGLAKSLSAGTHKVLLIDMDLRHRAIQSYLNKKNEVPNTGVTDVIAGVSTIPDVINSISDTFDVVFAGCENIKFKKSDFTEIFDYARENYDYIIVDMPSCSLASETVSIGDLCDELIFVVKWNDTSVDKVYSSIKYLSFSKTNILGYVLNHVSIAHGDFGKYKHYHYHYGYGYGYGYGKRKAVATETATSNADMQDISSNS